MDHNSMEMQSSTSTTLHTTILLDGMTTSQASALLSVLSIQVIGVSSAAEVGETATWTHITVVYCTQDVHVGACTTTYQLSDGSANRTVHHNGAANVRSVMDWVYGNFPQPDVLAFMGCSAGASFAPVFEVARAKSYYGADTTIVALGDSATNLLTDEFVTEGLPSWGAYFASDGIPGFAPDEIPSSYQGDMTSTIFSLVVSRYPDVQFGYVTRTRDSLQLWFAEQMGGLIPPELDLDAMLEMWNRHNLALLEGLQTANPNFRTFVAAGNGHCLYTFDHVLQEPGFVTWLEDLLNGGAPPAVACSTCTLAGVPGCDGVNGSGQIEDRCGVCGGSGASCAARNATLEELSCAVDDPEDDYEKDSEVPVASGSSGQACPSSWVCAGAVVYALLKR